MQFKKLLLLGHRMKNRIAEKKPNDVAKSGEQHTFNNARNMDLIDISSNYIIY